MNKVAGPIAFLLVLSSALPVCAQGKLDADEAAIRKIVDLFSDGRCKDNVESYRKCVHPDARLLYKAADGRLIDVPYSSIFTNLSQNADDRQVRIRRKATVRIIGLTVTDESAAVSVEFVDYEISVNGVVEHKAPDVTRVTYHLSLIKFDDGWRIVANLSGPSILEASAAIDDESDDPSGGKTR